MNKAKFIKQLDDYTGVAYAYELDSPLRGHSHVIVSAIDAPYSGEETYIFPAEQTSNGEWVVADWLELPGSYRGGMDHELALLDAGYRVDRSNP